MIVVADASPLIFLGELERLDLLRMLFTRVIVPNEVHAEVVERGAGLPGSAALAAAAWIEVVPAVDPSPLLASLRTGLDLGEAAAIVVALRERADVVLIDERKGRDVARRTGLEVLVTLGLLLRAKRAGLVAAIRPLLDELVRHGFWITDAVRERVLAAALEDTPGGP